MSIRKMHVFHKQCTRNLSYQIGLVKAFKEHDHTYISFELSFGAWNVVLFYFPSPDACVAIRHLLCVSLNASTAI